MPKPESIVGKEVPVRTRQGTLPSSVAVEQGPNIARNRSQLPRTFLLASGILLALVGLIPVYQYYQVVLNKSANIPYTDDFNVGLQFITDYTFSAKTPFEKLRLICSQYNEHRIILTRVVFLAFYALSGELNFRHITLFGNSLLLLVLWLLFEASFRQLRLPQKLFYFLPVPFLLFQMHYWEFPVWATGSVQNLSGLVFSLLSFYAIKRSTERPVWFALACLAAVLATFSNGNGVFTFVVGIPAWMITKQYRRLVIWLVVGVVAGGLYFWGYEKPAELPPLFELLFKEPRQFFDYFFALSGSVWPERPFLTGELMVALFLGLLAWTAYQRALTANLTVLLMLAFIYITCLAVTAARSGYGVTQALSARYGILPVMLCIGLYVLAVEIAGNRYAKPALALVGLALAVCVYKHSYELQFWELEDRAIKLSYSIALYNENADDLRPYHYKPQQSKAIFLEAVQNGVYRVPPITLADLKSRPQKFNAALSPAAGNVFGDVKPRLVRDYLFFDNCWAFIRGVPADDTRIRVVAQGKDVSYAFDVWKYVRPDIANQFKWPGYRRSGILCTINKGDLSPGRYRLWLVLTSPSGESQVPLEGSFDVEAGLSRSTRHAHDQAPN
jgi:hypothetical protein